MPNFTITVFEVYARQGSSWVAHARFPREERRRALEEARLLEREARSFARILRCTYDPASGSVEEVEVYVTRVLPEPMPARRVEPAAPPRPQAAPAPTEAAPVAPAASMLRFAGAAAALALLITALLAYGLGSRAGGAMLLAVFVLLFLAGTGIAVMVLLRVAVSEPGEPAAPAKPPPVVVPVAPPPAPPAAPAPVEPPVAEPPAAAATTEDDRLTLIKFLGGLIATLGKTRSQLDSHDRFGVCLLLGGAVEVMADRHALGETARAGLLSEVVAVLGGAPAATAAFAADYAAYLVEPRYLGMLQAGRDAMGRFLGGDPEAFGGVAPAMCDWADSLRAGSEVRVVAAVCWRDGEAALAPATEAERILGTLAQAGAAKLTRAAGEITACFASLHAAVDAVLALSVPAGAGTGRVGVAAAETVTGEAPYTAVVAAAASLCAQAAPGTILCSGVVRELSSGRPLAFTPVDGDGGPFYRLDAPTHGEEEAAGNAEAAPGGGLVPS